MSIRLKRKAKAAEKRKRMGENERKVVGTIARLCADRRITKHYAETKNEQEKVTILN